MDQTPHRDPDADAGPTLLGIAAEAADLSAGLTVMLLPLLTTALPGVVLLLVLPAALLALAVAIPAAVAAAFLAPPHLLIRAVPHRRARPR